MPNFLADSFIFLYSSSLFSISSINFIKFSLLKSSSKRIFEHPLSSNSLAFLYWWLFVTYGDGTNIDGSPIAVISAIVDAPARETIKSASFITFIKFFKNGYTFTFSGTSIFL